MTQGNSPTSITSIRIATVPRRRYPNSGLHATRFADRYRDEFWVVPMDSAPVEVPKNARFSWLESRYVWKAIPARLIRLMFLIEILARAIRKRQALYIVHSFMLALPLWLLNRRFVIVIHGSDRRYLNTWLGKRIAAKAAMILGIGFEMKCADFVVQRIENFFRPMDQVATSTRQYDVLFVLRNAPVKNPRFPLQCAMALGMRGISIGVFGIQEAELAREDLSSLQALRERGCRINYLGRGSYEDVVRMMAASGVLFIPSISEGIPKVMLEAMSQGTPVVVSSTIAVPPLLTNAVEKVDLDDWEAIYRAIQSAGRKRMPAMLRSLVTEYASRSESAISEIYDRLYSDGREIQSRKSGDF